jgi:hypothetical protein
VPLVRAAVDNWARLGAGDALTGPIARGDETTVERHREAIAARAPTCSRSTTRSPARRARSPPGHGMRTVRTVAALREALEPERRAGRTVGLVPTMGALHAGHAALIAAARASTDVVVVTLFVNPSQFDEASDLAAIRATRTPTPGPPRRRAPTCSSPPRSARSTPTGSRPR